MSAWTAEIYHEQKEPEATVLTVFLFFVQFQFFYFFVFATYILFVVFLGLKIHTAQWGADDKTIQFTTPSPRARLYFTRTRCLLNTQEKMSYGV